MRPLFARSLGALPLLALFTLSACSYDTQLEGFTFECSDELPCGEGMVCNTSLGECVAAAVAALPPICMEQACTTEEALRCDPDGAAVQRCVRDQSLGCLIWVTATDIPCSDGLSCTEDICDPAALTCEGEDCPPLESACSNVLTDGCIIEVDGEPDCVDTDAKNPDADCEYCKPQVATDAWSVLTDGTPCTDDGHACTTDTCIDPSGACDHTLTDGCLLEVDGELNCIDEDAKNPAADCEYCKPKVATDTWSVLTDGTPCTDDGHPCTDDACIDPSGVCVHTLTQGCFIEVDGEPNCIAEDAKNPEADCEFCKPKVATDTWSVVTDGTPCIDDGHTCTADTCIDPSGVCAHTLSEGCFIDGACVVNDALEAPGGCTACVPAASTTTWTVVTDGRPCLDDGLPCTADTCTDPSGTCAHALDTGCLIDETCVDEDTLDAVGCRSCQPLVRDDGWTNLPTGADCDDENPCTVEDACNEGYCLSGGDKDCSDQQVCTNDACDPLTGECTSELAPGACFMDGACVPAGVASPDNACLACHPELSTDTWTPVMDGSGCDDADVCTVGDLCTGGVCQGLARDCDDARDCTDDYCESEADAGCINEVKSGQCLIDNQCWNQGAFQPGGDLCLGCFPDADPLAWAAAEDGASCDDGDLCAVSETCFGGVCQPGVPKDCSDNLGCTTDACNPTTGGCGSTLDEGSCLIDGGCEAAGQLDVPLGCRTCDPAAATDAWVYVTDATPCSDGNPCTQGDTCSEGICQAGGDKECSDGLDCTADACDPLTGGCTSTLDGGHCEIDGACVPAGELAPTNSCLACQPGESETAYSLRESGSPCDDSDICTLNDACDASGFCAGGQPLVCDDGVACTTDSCVSDDDTGCIADLDADQCLIDGACVAADATSVVGGCFTCAPTDDPLTWTERPGADADTGYCDDGLDCTVDACSADTGLCANTLAEGACLIDGVCRTTGDTREDNPCLGCNAEVKTDGWTPLWGNVCHPYPGGTATCEAGLCVFSCPEPLADCDAQAENGCETDTSSDLYHCGECANLCTGGLACVDSGCTADCGGLTKCGPYCADLETSTSHCGGCDNACAYENATSACSAGACALSQCDDGWVDTNADTADGCECQLSGDEVCDGLDNDCNGVIDDVAEDALATDAENCGACDEVCPAGNPGVVGTCEAGVCAEAFCGADTWNLDLAPGNGCEYGCYFSAAEESCDGLDENCNGEVDEGFELTSDPFHCGACNNLCEATALAPGQPDAVLSYTCAAGACFVGECESGWQDKDLDYTNGCEHAFVPDGTFHVHWLEGNDATADGSEDNPFATIQAAVTAVPGTDWVVQVAAGTYGKVVIGGDKPGITLQGAGNGLDGGEATQVNAPDFGVGITIAAHDTTVRDLRIEGGQYGLFAHNGCGNIPNDISAECWSAVNAWYWPCGSFGWDSDPDCEKCARGQIPACSHLPAVCCTDSLTGLVLQGLATDGHVGPEPGFSNPGEESAGVYLRGTLGASVLQTRVTDVQGGGGEADIGSLTDEEAAEGRVGAGLLLRACQDTLVSGLSVIDAHGGQSGSNRNHLVSGGVGVGLLAEGGGGLLVQGMEVVDPRGGAGIKGEAFGGDPRVPNPGGAGLGVWVSGGTGGTLSGLQLTGARGGDGGPDSADGWGQFLTKGQVGGHAAGVALTDGASGMTLEGVIGDLEGGANVATGAVQTTYGVWMDPESLHNDLSGLVYDGEPIVTVVGQTGVTLSGLQLTETQNPTNWGKLLVADSEDITLTDVSLGGIRGEDGRTGASGSGGQGADAVGLRVRGCTGTEINGLSVTDLQGGTGGDAGASYYPGAAGRALGVVLEEGTVGTTFTESTMDGLAPGTPADQAVQPQGTFGVWLQGDSLDNQIDESVVVDGDPVIYRYNADGDVISGHTLDSPTNTTNWGEVAILESANVTLEDLVIHGVQGSSGNWGHGLGSASQPAASGDGVAIRLSGCTGCAVTNAHVETIAGGEGGTGGGAGPGKATGVLVSGGTATLSGISVADVEGGYRPPYGNPGESVGVHVSNGADVNASALALWDLRGTKDDKGPAHGIWVESGSLSVQGLSAYGITGEANAIWVDALDPEHAVTVSQAVVSTVAGWCVDNNDNNALSKLQISNSALHACGEGGEDHARNTAVLGGMMYVDPLFVDPANGDLHLASASPGIDAGASGVTYCGDFSEEPEPNGCAANYGAYGGTAEAATKAGADHCVCE